MASGGGQMPEAGAEEQRAADAAEVARLGGEFGVGDTIGYSWVRYAPGNPGMTVIMLASVAVVTFGFTIEQAATASWVGALILGLVTAGVIVLIRRFNRRTRKRLVRRWFCWYAGGIVQTFPDERGTRVLRWTDVDSVTLTFNDADERFNGLSQCALAGADGTVVSMNEALGKSSIREVTDLAERLLSPRIGAAFISTYESGEPVIAGAWRIDRDGVTDRRGSVPWRDVREITIISEDHCGVVDPPSLIRITLSSGRSGPRLSLSGLPNGLFVPPLLEHVAASHRLPVHRTVVPPGKGG